MRRWETEHRRGLRVKIALIWSCIWIVPIFFAYLGWHGTSGTARTFLAAWLPVMLAFEIAYLLQMIWALLVLRGMTDHIDEQMAQLKQSERQWHIGEAEWRARVRLERIAQERGWGISYGYSRSGAWVFIDP